MPTGAAHRKRAKKMDKPKNPYNKGTLIWSVMEGDWSDLTIGQIAEVLDSSTSSIRTVINKIKDRTGYEVPRTRGTPGQKRGADAEKSARKNETKSVALAPKKKINCAGCAYWRKDVQGGPFCCKYMLDTGVSRIKLCGPGECTVKTGRGQGIKKKGGE